MARRAFHHQTPRFLLRRFAIDDLVHMVHRNGTKRPVSTRSAAAQEHYYSFYRPDGTRAVDVEDYLSEHVETGAAPRLARLAEGTDPVQPTSAALARFWAFLIVRSPRFRELGRQIQTHLGPHMAGFDAVRYVFGEGGVEWDERAATRLRARVAAQPPAVYLSPPTPNSEIRVMLRWIDDLEEKLAGLQWAVAEASSPVFCTSDNPVGIFRPTRDPRGFHGVSPDAEAEVRIALDPTHLLLGSHIRLGDDRFAATRQLITEANRSSARECQHAIFHLPGATPPGDLTLAAEPPRLAAPTITVGPSSGGDGTDLTHPSPNDPRLAEIIDATHAADPQESEIPSG